MALEPLHGVVVGRVDVGDTGRIIRFLSAEEGRVSLITHGARGKLKGLLEVGSNLVVARRRGRGDLDVVVDVVWQGGPRRARADLHRLSLLAYGCELCAAIAPEGAPAPKAFGLLSVWLELLEGDVAPGDGARLALEAKALTFAGLTPAFLRCALCGRPSDDRMRFDRAGGGAVHDACGANGPDVTIEWLLAVERLRRTPLAETVGDDLPAGPRTALADLAEWALGAGLRSRGLLDGLTDR
jgi:DNA repair protein RecO